MCPLIHDLILYSGKSVEDHGAGAAPDIVDGGLSEGDPNGERDCVAVDGREGVGHDRRRVLVSEEREAQSVDC